jgi:ATP-dependent DNA helicase RecQ
VSLLPPPNEQSHPSAMEDRTLLGPLKRYFGYDSFRPLQAEIIRDALAGLDVFALLPTGGGKSLCYQLPALIRDGLTVVVSPLIALMKDQVDALVANGVAATFLNSTLGEAESRKRLSGLYSGKYKLLYVAPERLMIQSFIARIREWSIALLAIDEAHCISEWGHDFRPEYRQLARLRDELPDTPMMALTATATERVRQDILRQLHLRNPRQYTASFNRPNLSYRVAPKKDTYAELRQFIAQRHRESGIVYCQSRKSAESLAARLSADGVAARPYHAGLADEERSANQDAFLRDHARVICATVAFGMGINKPNVRYVVHYDLPKNIEGYYQETGRAGRDGLPSECLLFFSPADVVKYQKFIDEVSDEEERRRSRLQLRQMVEFAECPSCRRCALLAYFGETYAEPNCGGCDNCLAPRDTYDGTVPAQKLLSTIIRARQAAYDGSGSFGLGHHLDVLLGLKTPKVERWGHDRLTTFGIGTDLPRSEWSAIGRELIRLGFLEQSTGEFATVSITEQGLLALRSRTAIALTRSNQEAATTGTRRRRKTAPVPSTVPSEQQSVSDSLFEKLRTLRRQLADSRGVPSYIVFSDATLREMARLRPRTKDDLLEVTGVGQQKLADYGAQFLDTIRQHLDGAGA